jgi:hypothetical protein
MLIDSGNYSNSGDIMADQIVISVTWYRDTIKQAFSVMKVYNDGHIVGYFTAGVKRRGFSLSISDREFHQAIAAVRALPTLDLDNKVEMYIGFGCNIMEGELSKDEYFCIPRDAKDFPAHQHIRQWAENLFSEGDKVAKH